MNITQKLTEAIKMAANPRCWFGGDWISGSDGGVWVLSLLRDARSIVGPAVGFRPDEIRELLRLAQVGLAHEQETVAKTTFSWDAGPHVDTCIAWAEVALEESERREAERVKEAPTGEKEST